MRRTLALVIRLALVPVGAGAGYRTAQLTPSDYQCPPNAVCPSINLYVSPTFSTWQCILFGAGAATVILLFSLVVARPMLASSLTASVMAAAAAGLGVGFWTAQLQSLQPCPPNMRCPPSVVFLERTFTAWECALFGAGAAVIVLLVCFAVTRAPAARSLEAT